MIAAATIGLSYLTQLVGQLFGYEFPAQANIDIVRRCAGWNLAFLYLGVQVVLIFPAIEEILFRYLLFKLPSKHIVLRPKLVITAVISSILFSAAHYIYQPFPDSAFLALGFFGLAQCYLYRRTDRLWCPILNHALFNLTNLVLLLTIPESLI